MLAAAGDVRIPMEWSLPPLDGPEAEEAFLSSVAPGHLIALLYEGEATWHEAIFLWGAGGHTAVILTPDCIGGVFGGYDGSSTTVVVLPENGHIPDDFPSDIYRF